MWIRRVFFWWQFAAVLVLPIWAFFARGIFGAQLGWDVIVAVIAAPALAVALLGVALLTFFRPSVHRTKAVSSFDVVVLALWHGSVIWLCFAPSGWVPVAIVGFAFVAFWGAIWQLVTDTTRRVSGAMRDFTVEFNAAVGEQQSGAPIELGELEPVDDGRPQ